MRLRWYLPCIVYTHVYCAHWAHSGGFTGSLPLHTQSMECTQCGGASTILCLWVESEKRRFNGHILCSGSICSAKNFKAYSQSVIWAVLLHKNRAFCLRSPSLLSKLTLNIPFSRCHITPLLCTVCVNTNLHVLNLNYNRWWCSTRQGRKHTWSGFIAGSLDLVKSQLFPLQIQQHRTCKLHKGSLV